MIVITVNDYVTVNDTCINEQMQMLHLPWKAAQGSLLYYKHALKLFYCCTIKISPNITRAIRVHDNSYLSILQQTYIFSGGSANLDGNLNSKMATIMATLVKLAEIVIAANGVMCSVDGGGEIGSDGSK